MPNMYAKHVAMSAKQAVFVTVEKCLALLLIVCSSPLWGMCALLVFFEDKKFPFFLAERVGLGGRHFIMVKIRTMRYGSGASGNMSTKINDDRLLNSASFIRRLKIDEITQLFNVLIGNMALVGPRPNCFRWGVELYTEIEQNLLSVKPGITDISSLVFFDEGMILKDSECPDLTYNQIIRPWKSRLGLFYVENKGILLDTAILVATVICLFDKSTGRKFIATILSAFEADKQLCEFVINRELTPLAPPGAAEIERGDIYLQ